MRALLVVCFLMGPVFVAAAKIDPKVRTEAFLEQVKTVHAPPADENASLSLQERQTNKHVFSKIDSYFDFDRLVGDPIASHRAKLSKEQYKRYSLAFKSLLRMVGYTKASAFLNRAELAVKDPMVIGPKAEVEIHAAVKAEDLETSVKFFWESKKGRWKIVDVSFDGASLVKDYANQFAKVIETEGTEALIKKLEERLQKEQADKAAVI
jgi:phospholipid transport system substrate-binding protein